VILLPEKKSFRIPGDTSLLYVLEKAGIHVDAPCGGKGLCGKCKILVKEGLSTPNDTEKNLLTETDISQGFRLACQTRPVSDIVIEIPLESRLDFKMAYLSSLKGEVYPVAPGSSLKSDFKKIFLSLKKPALTDQRSDWERIKGELFSRETDAFRTVKMNIDILKQIPGIMREADYNITVTLCDQELIDVEKGNTVKEAFGLAFDIGTTTVAGYLLDLVNGTELSVVARANPQIVYGDDVITRIGFAHENEDGLRKLQSVILNTLNEIIQETTQRARIKKNNIYKIVISGNTTMHHLLLGLPVTFIAASPYIPVIREGITLKAKELPGINLPPNAQVYFTPHISAFVGADISTGILSSGLWKSKKTILFVDLGTNGEIVLGNKDKIWACSTAAGPAFEGARISSGMRAATGAIDRVSIEDDHLIYHTLEDGKIRGICGSGLIDLVAKMLDLGLIDKTGRLIDPAGCRAKISETMAKRIVQNEKKNQFLVADGSETQSGHPLFITQKDIREVQLAKAAIFAGITTLLKEAAIHAEDIDEVLLAGAFGNFINKESARRLGLIPSLALNKIASVGNAAGKGSEIVLLSDKMKRTCSEIARETEYVELSSRKDFQKEFMDAMYF